MAVSFLFWALLLLTLPLNWLVAAFLAAAWHELCHYTLLRFLGGRAEGFRLGLTGATLDVSGLTPGTEFVTALAGPLGGFLLTFLWRQFPRLSLCAAAQSVFNLLPIYPLDGGRALRCILKESLFTALERFILAALAVLCLCFGLWFPLIWGLLCLLARKRPCKAPLLKVQ